MKLSEEAINYVKRTWGLDQAEECDAITMLWSSGYYEQAVKLIADGGGIEGVCEASKELLRVAKSISEDDVHGAIEQCLKYDYKMFNCKHCNSIHFVNSLYWDYAEDWPCQSCGETGLRKITK